MKKFILEKKVIESLNGLLDKLNISKQDIIKKSSVYSINSYEVEKTLKSILENDECSIPLFSKKISNVDSMKMVRIFFDRLQDEDYFDYYNERKVDLNYSLGERLYFILTGSFVTSLLGKRIAEIDHKEYGFNYVDEFLYSLGAHISNIQEIEDHREYFCEYDAVFDNKEIVNAYESNIHGDFRFVQYDVSEKTSKNEFHDYEKLPFGLPKRVGVLYGYHSVESSFLAGLLGFSLFNKIDISLIDDFDSFFSEIKSEGQRYGNFSDIGTGSNNMSVFNFMTLKYNKLPSVIMESQAKYDAKIKDGKLIYEHDNGEICAVIYPEMIEELIKGLFIAVNNGISRTTIFELECGVKYFIENLKNIEKF